MPITLEFAATVDGDTISGTVKLGTFGDATFEGTRSGAEARANVSPKKGTGPARGGVRVTKPVGKRSAASEPVAADVTQRIKPWRIDALRVIAHRASEHTRDVYAHDVAEFVEWCGAW